MGQFWILPKGDRKGHGCGGGRNDSKSKLDLPNKFAKHRSTELWITLLDTLGNGVNWLKAWLGTNWTYTRAKTGRAWIIGECFPSDRMSGNENFDTIGLGEGVRWWLDSPNLEASAAATCFLKNE